MAALPRVVRQMPPTPAAMEHTMIIQHRLMALGLAGALALGTAVSASAGPLPIGNSGLKAAVSSDTTEIRWRGRGSSHGIWPGRWPAPRWRRI